MSLVFCCFVVLLAGTVIESSGVIRKPVFVPETRANSFLRQKRGWFWPTSLIEEIREILGEWKEEYREYREVKREYRERTREHYAALERRLRELLRWLRDLRSLPIEPQWDQEEEREREYYDDWDGYFEEHQKVRVELVRKTLGIIEFLKSLIDKIKDFISSLAKALKALARKIRDLLKRLKRAIERIWKQIKRLAKGFWDKVKKTAKKIWRWFWNIVQILPSNSSPKAAGTALLAVWEPFLPLIEYNFSNIAKTEMLLQNFTGAVDGYCEAQTDVCANDSAQLMINETRNELTEATLKRELGEIWRMMKQVDGVELPDYSNKLALRVSAVQKMKDLKALVDQDIPMIQECEQRAGRRTESDKLAKLIGVVIGQINDISLCMQQSMGHQAAIAGDVAGQISALEHMRETAMNVRAGTTDEDIDAVLGELIDAINAKLAELRGGGGGYSGYRIGRV